MQNEPEAENNGGEVDEPEAHYYFFFGPAFKFIVVVQGCHFEDAPAEKVPADHLDNHCQSFDYENERQKWQNHNGV